MCIDNTLPTLREEHETGHINIRESRQIPRPSATQSDPLDGADSRANPGTYQKGTGSRCLDFLSLYLGPGEVQQRGNTRWPDYARIGGNESQF